MNCFKKLYTRVTHIQSFAPKTGMKSVLNILGWYINTRSRFRILLLITWLKI